MHENRARNTIGFLARFRTLLQTVLEWDRDHRRIHLHRHRLLNKVLLSSRRQKLKLEEISAIRKIPLFSKLNLFYRNEGKCSISRIFSMIFKSMKTLFVIGQRNVGDRWRKITFLVARFDNFVHIHHFADVGIRHFLITLAIE